MNSLFRLFLCFNSIKGDGKPLSITNTTLTWLCFSYCNHGLCCILKIQINNFFLMCFVCGNFLVLTWTGTHLTHHFERRFDERGRDWSRFKPEISTDFLFWYIFVCNFSFRFWHLIFIFNHFSFSGKMNYSSFLNYDCIK